MGIAEGTFNQAATMLLAQIGARGLVWYFCLGVLLLLSMVYFVRSWIYLKKRSWESFYFIILCVPVIIWTLTSLLVATPVYASAATITEIFKYSADTVIPALLCLHVWSQVSYKPILPFTWVRYMLVPVVLIAAMTYSRLSGAPIIEITTEFNDFTWEQLLFGIYMVFMFARCYLLCFNVFYQMPNHMRLSTFYLLTGITAMAAAKVAFLFLSDSLAFIIEALAVGLLLERLFSAFFIANSSNVIVTSREFVFTSLSTIVITVSRKGRILDWNKKGELGFGPLPQPVYKQPFEKYRQQFIEEGRGKVSAHDNNIVTATYDGVERHYLFLYHEIRHKSRLFGYLVEISEVTKIYSVLRFLEEIAIIDQLTGMYNRNAYINMARAMTSQENLPLLVMVGDVNNLKQMNDTIGHLCGDKLLITIAKLVLSNAPKGSFAARIGGDELVLLHPASNEDIAREFIETVTRKCEAVNDPEFGTPSISWGYAFMTTADDEYNAVFAKADEMMIERKKLFKEIVSSRGYVPPITPQE
ncbi:MAG: GGDEF domain-containing protein [Clostridiales Family XIII bacterium]|jgi:diguanylate cyclase (GGDEF)-like protein|nr:GGDEF domain-containing protein [Clostridiales Family XIII bacterium]